MPEIIVGLPHLRHGPILDRAIAMQQPMLISANCLSRWRKTQGTREWSGWNLEPLSKAHRLKSLDLDSAGFVATAHYGGLPWTIEQYIQLAASFPFRRFASVDYCCEAEIAAHREEVLDRISRTIAANRQCHAIARDYGIQKQFMPVLQGRRPDDYARCADSLHALVNEYPVIGVGSMCRRPIHGREGLLSVIQSLDQVLPANTQLHLFGVKGAAIPWLKPYAQRVSSIDSQAWGIAARYQALRSNRSKSDSFAADAMEHWTTTQLTRTLSPAKTASFPISMETHDTMPTDRWNNAIAAARQQFRELIEEGALDHDEITCCWIEQTAADIYHASIPQPQHDLTQFASLH